MLTEKLFSAGSLCLLVAAIVGFSEQARRSVSNVLNSGLDANVAVVSDQMSRLNHAVTTVLGSYAGNHMLLLLFGLMGGALLVLMFRT